MISICNQNTTHSRAETRAFSLRWYIAIKESFSCDKIKICVFPLYKPINISWILLLFIYCHFQASFKVNSRTKQPTKRWIKTWIAWRHRKAWTSVNIVTKKTVLRFTKATIHKKTHCFSQCLARFNKKGPLERTADARTCRRDTQRKLEN